MRIATLAFLLTLATAAFARDIHIHVDIGDDGAGHASFARDGVRYETHDRDVLRAIERAMEKHRNVAHEHREIGHRHREIGREHARIGREHARLGREHARGGLSRAELERRQNELEELQDELEARQKELEREQEALDERRRVMENDVNRAIEEIFTKAVRDGKARRTN